MVYIFKGVVGKYAYSVSSCELDEEIPQANKPNLQNVKLFVLKNLHKIAFLTSKCTRLACPFDTNQRLSYCMITQN